MMTSLMAYSNSFILALLIGYFLMISTAQDDSSSSKPFHCHAIDPDNYTCANCISLDARCAWCASPGYDDDSSHFRCGTEAELRKGGCEKVEAARAEIAILKDEPFSDSFRDATATGVPKATQIRPQIVRLRLRPRESHTLNIRFRQASEYPVDLYYLMDMSYSMKDDKEKVSELGNLIAQEMMTVTRNFRLGFGSFIDKRVAPFADVRPEVLAQSCGANCVPPYGFINQMPLSKNTQLFAQKVRDANLARNIDEPEGGFDAFMQVLACQDQIGWQQYSRKMVVFSTDASYHSALDGRLAGITTPNDMECHLSESGEYTESTTQDYPSIGQIHHKLLQTKASVIFAVTDRVKHLYQSLKDALRDVPASVAVLRQDSSNIVELIKDEYEKISEKIIMVDTAQAGLKVSYKTPCKSGVWKDTNVCEGVKVLEEIEFNVTLTAPANCDGPQRFTFTIGPSGLAEAVDVQLDVICDCECDKDKTDFAKQCNHNGDFVCGVCDCNGNNRGRNCECNAPGVSSVELDARCKKGNDPRAPVCEGRGTCECGQCQCAKRANLAEVISGKFCECDNFNCPRNNRKLCNDRGVCECQECVCNAGWSGRACECSTNQETCKSTNGKICNGVGFCQCGICRCFESDEGMRYSGPTCEDCPTCPQKCQRLQPCVQCRMFESGAYSDSDRCVTSCDYSIYPVNELPSTNRTSLECQAIDSTDGCTFYWVYSETDPSDANVWALKEKRCPQPVSAMLVIFGVVAVIVLIGLIMLLLWKLITWWQDKREYERFKNDLDKSQWQTNLNPIHVPPTTTHINPAFKSKNL